MRTCRMRLGVMLGAMFGVAVLPLALLATVTEVTFPTKDGDLASNAEDGWNGAKPGAGDDVRVVIGEAGDYSISSDVTFGAIKASVDGVTIENNATVTLNPSSGMMFNGPNVQNATTTLRGGTWKSTASKDWWVAGLGWDGDTPVGSGYTLILDGAEVSTAGNFTLAKQRSNITLVLTNNASLAVASGSNKDARLIRDSGSGVTLDIGPGCSVTAPGVLYSDTLSTAGSRSDVLVDIHGDSALFTGGNYLTSGNKGTYNCWRVRDGGTLSASVGGTFYLGVNTASTDNRLEVLGGEIALGTVQAQGPRGTVVISNGIASVAKVTVAASASDMRLLVEDGSSFVISTTDDGLTLNGTSGAMTVRDDMTMLTMQGKVALNGEDNAIVVSNGAWMSTKAVNHLGQRGSLRVDGATVTIENGFTIGSSSDSTANGARLELVNGAQATIGWVYPFSADNTIVVDNSTLTLSSEFAFGGASAKRNTLIVRGANATMPKVPADPFAEGPSENTLVLDDGFSWRLTGNRQYFKRSFGNVLRITGGAVMDNTSDDGSGRQTYIGEKSNDYCHDNAFEVTAGGQLLVDRFFVTGHDNALVVSNGTVAVKSGTDTTYGLWFGYNVGGYTGEASAGNRLVIQGATSSITCGQPTRRPMMIGGTSALRYEIPEEGYAADAAPLQASELRMDAGSTFEIECAKWAAAHVKTGATATLFKGVSNLTDALKEHLVAQVAGKLPSGVSLTFTKTDVVLVRKREWPLAIMLK